MKSNFRSPARAAIAVALKRVPLIAIAIFSWLTMATSAARVASPALPSDAELRKWIVGKWRVDYPNEGSAERFGYESYSENGTFKHLGEVKEYAASPRLLFKTSGTWDVQNGVFVKKTTAANVSTWIGNVIREKIESANRDGFITRGEDGPRTRRRSQFPAELASDAVEVPKVFTAKEAAQVLRSAVKPEYSREVSARGASGFGLFELRFDYETGQLKGIDIVKSTGTQLLDHNAIAMLKEWKAKPHTVRIMRVPITFEPSNYHP